MNRLRNASQVQPLTNSIFDPIVSVMNEGGKERVL